ncbi:C4-dicarboxylate ABC transporter [Salinisphaera orenii MK-B5]|uniref:TRAP transporter large permease protein n=2 Tax=Salinisphaera orenii TaxID=856731 RepID=A0A423PM19_9GAMM|nr:MULTISPECIES: TRAP transporter large permease subunit [Salinisphaera]ROO26665.1 C4-dicarboxylate ABC transporter [Salinisphaera orenii MK-B5]ROO30886.1 C4-dicarboxylate ABC transporter [Salinisphaera halophila YIM 95161]
MDYLSLWMFAAAIGLLLIGYPVAFSLGGTAVLFTLIGSDLLPDMGVTLPWEPAFRVARLNILPGRIFGNIMNNYELVAVPFFVFMGVMLEKSRLASDLLETMGLLFGRMRGGLAISVVVVGTLLAASTGVVGASVVTMGVLALPVMLKYNYDKGLASGTVAASGTLGQIIPPSIVLIILGDQMQVSVGDLFLGALLPGVLLAGLFIAWIAFVALRYPERAPALPAAERNLGARRLLMRMAVMMAPPLALILVVLGTIFAGIAAPAEAGAMGALGASLLALANGRLNWPNLRAVMDQTVKLTAMVFVILLGATAFTMVFAALGGPGLVDDMLVNLPGGTLSFLFFTMLVIFVLGFFIDFIEISFIVVPVITPIAIKLGVDPLWFAVMIALNLQASFLTPPFGFALFYLKGVAPPAIRTIDIYRGVMPFIAIQLLALVLLWLFPQIVLWLPHLSDAVR